jgi:hypothetical protein
MSITDQEAAARIVALQEANKWATTRATHAGGRKDSAHAGTGNVVEAAGTFLDFLLGRDNNAAADTQQ